MTYPSSILKRVTKRGYSTKEQVETMSKLSSQFAMISPGASVEDSTDYLVSTMQAFDIQTDEVQRKIMDNVNAVGKILPKHMVTYGVYNLVGHYIG